MSLWLGDREQEPEGRVSSGVSICRLCSSCDLEQWYCWEVPSAPGWKHLIWKQQPLPLPFHKNQEVRKVIYRRFFFCSSSLAAESHNSVIQPGCGPTSNRGADLEQLLEQHLSLSETLETSNIWIICIMSYYYRSSKSTMHFMKQFRR